MGWLILHLLEIAFAVTALQMCSASHVTIPRSGPLLRSRRLTWSHVSGGYSRLVAFILRTLWTLAIRGLCLGGAAHLNLLSPHAIPAGTVSWQRGYVFT
jgi:hypothetical protein